MEENQIHIPEGWISGDLGNLIKEKRKSSLKVSDAANYGEFPFFTSGEAVLEHTSKQLDGKNIFLATGGVANIKYYEGDAAFSTDTYAITTKEDVDTKYLYFDLLNILYYINANYFQGSGLKHLQKKDLKKHQILFPKNPKEQTQIATILSKVDEAIAQTEQLIAKYTRIKTGLMQDLLTKGIDENGNIRSEETHEFKDSPLGRIPKEWEVVELQTLYKNPIRDFGSFSSTNLITFLDEGVPFIKSEMIEENRINWESVSFISEEVHKLLSKSYVAKGNILFSKIGSALGKAVVFDLDISNCNSNAAVAKIDINNKIATNEYVTFYLNSFLAKNQFSYMIISLLPRINLGDINKLLIPKFSIMEQNEIMKVLDKNEQLIKRTNDDLTKLQSLKTGLMQDLLSGKVRVNHLIKETVSV